MADRIFRKHAFCYQDKPALRRLRKHWKEGNITPSLHSKLRNLYLTLTEIESDFGKDEIEHFTNLIHSYSGLSKDFIPSGLKILAELGLVELETIRDEHGRFQGRIVRLLDISDPPHDPPKTVPGKPINGEPANGNPDATNNEVNNLESSGEPLKKLDSFKKLSTGTSSTDSCTLEVGHSYMPIQNPDKELNNNPYQDLCTSTRPCENTSPSTSTMYSIEQASNEEEIWLLRKWFHELTGSYPRLNIPGKEKDTAERIRELIFLLGTDEMIRIASKAFISARDRPRFLAYFIPAWEEDLKDRTFQCCGDKMRKEYIISEDETKIAFYATCNVCARSIYLYTEPYLK